MPRGWACEDFDLVLTEGQRAKKKTKMTRKGCMRRVESQVSRVGTFWAFHCWNILLCLCVHLWQWIAPLQQVKCFLSFMSLEPQTLSSEHTGPNRRGMHTESREWKGRKASSVIEAWLAATLLILITRLQQELEVSSQYKDFTGIQDSSKSTSLLKLALDWVPWEAP